MAALWRQARLCDDSVVFWLRTCNGLVWMWWCVLIGSSDPGSSAKEAFGLQKQANRDERAEASDQQGDFEAQGRHLLLTLFEGHRWLGM